MADTVKKKAARFIPATITKQQAVDSGMAFTLICLILGLALDIRQLLVLAVPMLLVNMTVPMLYKPAAKIWLGLSTLLGTIVSKVILSVLFIALVTPVGVCRKLLGADPLQLKQWKKGSESAFTDRNHIFSSDDVTMPY